MIFYFRRASIVARKIDYLVEDLTYKSELLTPIVESIIKISDFIDLFQAVIAQKYDSLIKYANQNKESIYKVAKDLKQIIKEK